MHDILDKEKLEGILIAKWSEFLHIRKLIDFAKESLIKYLLFPKDLQLVEIRISRFELTSIGFVLWLEIIVTHSGQKINATLEASLSNIGEISYVGCELS